MCIRDRLISAFDSDGLQEIASNSNFNLINVTQNYTIPEDIISIYDSKNNTVEILEASGIITGDLILCQLKQYAIDRNYGGYEYVSLKDVVNNFMVAYVGIDKLIPRVKRSDVIFHAKRGLQEFSYDTLRSVKSQELTIPPSLSVPIPQDYVNYVRLSYIDESGVKRIIYPVNNLTISPTELLIQDNEGIATQDSFGGNNLAEGSLTGRRWRNENTKNITGQTDIDNTNVYDWAWWKMNYGQRYGLEPEVSQKNGWFQIDRLKNKFSFSSGLVGNLIVLEYISDGLAYGMDSKFPKMAEDAIYAHINHAILSTRSNTQEYIVQRYKQERSAKLRNAKIRLSNIKLDEIIQVFRGKSKWIKN